MNDLCWKIHDITFVCDANKRLDAIQKHNIDFLDASTAFFDRYACTFYDSIHSIDEDRFILIGQTENAVMVFIVHTERDDVYRIISARRAEKHEVKLYAARAKILHSH